MLEHRTCSPDWWWGKAALRYLSTLSILGPSGDWYSAGHVLGSTVGHSIAWNFLQHCVLWLHPCISLKSHLGILPMEGLEKAAIRSSWLERILSQPEQRLLGSLYVKEKDQSGGTYLAINAP